MTLSLADALADAPVIAILRGLRPEEARVVGAALADAGVRALETPLNSPEPLSSIAILAETLRGRAVVGAGTVLSPDDVEAVAAAGGRFVVAPNTDVAVIERARERGLEAIPGIATPTEAFHALRAGARRLKLYPASTYGPAHMRALRDVLPADADVFAVGGVDAAALAAWRDAGAAGVGVGSHIYRPGASAAETAARAAVFVTHAREIWRSPSADRTAR